MVGRSTFCRVRGASRTTRLGRGGGRIFFFSILHKIGRHHHHDHKTRAWHTWTRIFAAFSWTPPPDIGIIDLRTLLTPLPSSSFHHPLILLDITIIILILHSMATITPLVWPYPHHPHVAHHCHQHPHLVGQVRRAAHTLHQLVEARRDTIEKLLLGADYLDSVSHCHHRHKHCNHNCHRHWHHCPHIPGHFRCGCDVKWAKQLARARALLVVDSLLQVRGDKFKTLYHSVLYPVQYSWTVIFRPMIITWSSWWRRSQGGSWLWQLQARALRFL